MNSGSNRKTVFTKTPKISNNFEDEDEEGPPDWERQPLPFSFEKELIENSNRHIRLTEEFIPCGTAHPLEGKFYARHDQHIPSNVSLYEKYLDEKKIKTMKLPILESNAYGFLQDCLKPNILVELNRVMAPKQRCLMTKIGEKVAAEPQTERPAFNGLRFIVT